MPLLTKVDTFLFLTLLILLTFEKIILDKIKIAPTSVGAILNVSTITHYTRSIFVAFGPFGVLVISNFTLSPSDNVR